MLHTVNLHAIVPYHQFCVKYVAYLLEGACGLVLLPQQPFSNIVEDLRVYEERVLPLGVSAPVQHSQSLCTAPTRRCWAYFHQKDKTFTMSSLMELTANLLFLMKDSRHLL